MSEAKLETIVAGSKRDRGILLAGLITYGIGQTLLYIIFAPLGKQIGMPEWQIGTIISISNLAILFAAPFWGRKSDSMGRRAVFVIGMLGYAAGYLGLALGIQAGVAGVLIGLPLFLSLFAARLLYGCLAGAAQPAAQAYIADTTDESSRAQGMALIAASGGLGTIIGPVFARALAEIGPLFPMYAAAALGLIAAVWAQFNLVEPARHVTEEKPAGMVKVFAKIFPYLLGWFVVFFVFTEIQTIATFMVADKLDVAETQDQIRVVGNAFFFMAIVTVIMQVIVMQKWKLQPRVLLRTAFIVFGLILLPMTAMTSTTDMYLIFAAMGFAVSLAMPSLSSAASLSVGRREQGVAAGLLAAAPTCGMVFGPMIGGVLYGAGPEYPIWLGAGMVILTGVYFWFVRIPEAAAADASAS
jgi:MFS family permease